MKKEDEMIMCLDKATLFVAGAIPDAERVIKATTAPGVATMRRRGDVETDKSLVQPIPYVVFIAPSDQNDETSDAKVLLYTRSSSGGEKRLQDKCSIGIGGHLNLEDIHEYLNNASMADPTVACMLREVSEELGVTTLTDCDLFVRPDVIYSDKEDVSSVHIGILHFIYLREIPEIKVENALKEVSWVPLKETMPGGEYFDKLESWSQIVTTDLSESMSSL